MNLQYLDTLPMLDNKYHFELEADEKPVFNTVLEIFGNERDQLLGTKCLFTMTNKKIFIDTGENLWIVDLADDVVLCELTQWRKFFFSISYFKIDLNKEVIYGNDPDQKLCGYHLYFKHRDKKKFQTIISQVFL